MDSSRELRIPGTDMCIRPGYHVRLGRFDAVIWVVGFGWYSNGGNRPCCGWYLTTLDRNVTKPLQLPDLADIYIVEQGCTCDDDRPVAEIDAELIDIRKAIDGTIFGTAGDAVRSQLGALSKMIPRLDKIEFIQGALRRNEEADPLDPSSIETLVMLLNHTTDEWSTITDVVPLGCPCLEYREEGSFKLKIGDGIHSFSELDYLECDLDKMSIIDALGYVPADQSQVASITHALAQELAQTKLQLAEMQSSIEQINEKLKKVITYELI